MRVAAIGRRPAFDFAAFAPDSVVDAQTLREAGLIRGKKRLPVKILSNGEIAISLVFRVDKLTAVSREKIEAAGGKVEVVGDDSSSA